MFRRVPVRSEEFRRVPVRSEEFRRVPVHSEGVRHILMESDMSSVFRRGSDGFPGTLNDSEGFRGGFGGFRWSPGHSHEFCGIPRDSGRTLRESDAFRGDSEWTPTDSDGTPRGLRHIPRGFNGTPRIPQYSARFRRILPDSDGIPESESLGCPP